ncbi:Vacuolar protein sorting-associated protein 26 [Elasticomyces elasticus]|nr:Vacuolar protein sorting-associated protein 26 [Elasticomyces elasticus]
MDVSFNTETGHTFFTSEDSDLVANVNSGACERRETEPANSLNIVPSGSYRSYPLDELAHRGSTNMKHVLPLQICKPESNSVTKIHVGIEDCLHIESDYSKSEYHLKDMIVARICFLPAWLKIWHVELSIIGRETAGVPTNQYDESEILARFEIMDGPPYRGETIPIRFS